MSGEDVRAKIEYAMRKKFVVSAVFVDGNDRTNLSVIDAEINVSTDPQNIKDLNRNLQLCKVNLMKLDIFEEAHIKVVPSSQYAEDGDIIPVEIHLEVREKGILKGEGGMTRESGEFKVNAGGAIRNSLGLAEHINFGIDYGSISKSSYDLSLSKRHLFGCPGSFNLNFYKKTTNYRLSSSSKTNRNGIKLTWNDEQNSNSFSINGETRDLDVELNDNSITTTKASQEILKEAIQKNSKIAFEHTFRWKSNPQTSFGLELNVASELASLGGQHFFAKTSGYLKHSYLLKKAMYDGLNDSVILENKILWGAIFPFSSYSNSLISMNCDKETFIHDRFFLGGESFKCFAHRGMGGQRAKRNTSDKKAKKLGKREHTDGLGGDLSLSCSTILRFPLPIKELREMGLHGKIFGNIGNLQTWKQWTNFSNFYENYRASFGLGVGMATPLGYLSISYGKIFKMGNLDNVELFQFGIE